jgi:hypothetical protein
MKGSTMQVIGSFAAAAFAWVILEFVGRPLRKFFDLRGEIIRHLTETANVSAQYQQLREEPGIPHGSVLTLELTDAEKTRLIEARKTIRDLASQLRAFALNETSALYAVRFLGYDPLTASRGLLGLSNCIDTYGDEKAFHKKTTAKALKMREV